MMSAVKKIVAATAIADEDAEDAETLSAEALSAEGASIGRRLPR